MSGLAHWVWNGESVAARAIRVGLNAPSLGLSAVTRMRASAYRNGLLQTHRLPLPSVSVGNLTVGGTGKTPVASWIAAQFAGEGITPGILLRGYGGDETDVHRHLVPGAVVVADPDRRRGARLARELGAQVLVLDDAFQRLDVRRDLNILLVAAESLGKGTTVPRTLPAGPWREDWRGATRADLVVVTRKRVPAEQARDVAVAVRDRVRPHCPIAVAELHLSSFRGLHSGAEVAPNAAHGEKVLAIAGVADPASFVAQLEALGAVVEGSAWPDHHGYTRRDVQRIARSARRADRVVMTLKDAVKLRRLWPADLPEPWIARLSVSWDSGETEISSALHDLTIHAAGAGNT